MNLNALIKRLNDLKDFDINDLKNIDPEVIKEYLLSRRDVLVCLIISIIGVTGIIMLLFFGHKESSKLKGEMTQLQAKNEAFKNLEADKAAVKKFIETAKQPIPSENLIDVLNDMAINNNVQILTFSPAKKESRSAYNLAVLEMQVSAGNYADLWSFMRAIEQSQYALRSDSWRGQMRDSNRSKGKNSNSNSNLNITITVGSIEVVEK